MGDYSDRVKPRDRLDPTQLALFVTSLQMQLKSLWMNVEFLGQMYGYKKDWAWNRGIRNNAHWLRKLSLMDFLSTVGRGQRIGAMLARETCVPFFFYID